MCLPLVWHLHYAIAFASCIIYFNCFQGAKADDQYLRVQPRIPQTNGSMDDTSSKNIAELQGLGARAAIDQRGEIENFVSQYIVPMGPRKWLTSQDYEPT